MPNNSVENFVSNTAAALIGGAIVTGLALVTGDLNKATGPALTTLIWLTLIGAGVSFFVLFKYYFDVLGSAKKAKNTREHQAYESLRNALSAGGFTSQTYVRRLIWFLDKVDRFFGDAGKADRTLFPHAFGLRTPAPLWTAPSFDRCLLLALVYPIATIFLIWAVSGHVGPAEAALGLKSSIPLRLRMLALLLLLVSTSCLRKTMQAKVWLKPIWFAFTAAGGFVALTITGAGAGAVVLVAIAVIAVVYIIGDITVAGTGATAVAFAVAFVAFAFLSIYVFTTIIVALATTIIVAVATTIVVAVVCIAAVTATVAVTYDYAIRRNLQGGFLLLYMPMMIAIMMIAAWFLSPLLGWEKSGPLLLFLGLLTLLNAPFDWLSLGLTRALLRRSIELKSWWPYGLAIVDATLAVAIIFLLACVMVVGVQAFDMLATLHHGKPVLPLAPLFDGIARNPGAPEYWWIYALLFSTMIPSVINLAIGGASLLRGVPRFSALILRYMPAGKAVAALDRNWMALLLTSQWLLGAALGIAAQGFLVWVFFGHILPWIGFDMLAVARSLADFNLPMHVYRLFV